jgi:hypothetical protein
MNAPIIPPEAQAMRMPRVRFTMRGMMVAVAITGAVVAGEKFRRARDSHLHRAAVHSYSAMLWSSFAESYRANRRDDSPPAQMDAIASWNTAMSRKYERAARYPWLPVPPDPPEPELR